MKKTIIIGLIILTTIFFLGCEGFDVSQLSDEDLERISEKAIVCEEPYIRFGSSCCLDENENSICDKDEEAKPPTEYKTEIKPSCSDECSKGLCKGKEYFSCSKQTDGCYDEVNRGKIVGKCGIECATNSKCDISEECNGYKCVKKIACSDECSSTSCEGTNFIDCIKQSDGCSDEFNKGKLIGKCNVVCLSKSDCPPNQECFSNKCYEQELEKELECPFKEEITVYVYSSSNTEWLIRDYDISVDYYGEEISIKKEGHSSGERSIFCVRGGSKYEITVSKEGYQSESVTASTYQRVTQDISVYLEPLTE